MADAIPRLLLKAEDKNLWSVILHHADGKTTTLPCATPAEHLIAASEIDYRPYRREIQTLREQHPFFETRFEVSLEDFEDFVAEALLLPSMLQEVDPVGYFVLGLTRWGTLFWGNSWTNPCGKRMTTVHHSSSGLQSSCFRFWRSLFGPRCTYAMYWRLPVTAWSEPPSRNDSRS